MKLELFWLREHEAEMDHLVQVDLTASWTNQTKS